MSIKKIWIHFENDRGGSIFYDFTSREEARKFIDSFEEDEEPADNKYANLDPADDIFDQNKEFLIKIK